MDFKELTYVLALARHQSVTKAAQELYLTQPALTRFLQRLETSVGQPLFTRSGNRLIPTYAGEKYIERARRKYRFEKQLDAGMRISSKCTGDSCGSACRSSVVFPYCPTCCRNSPANIRM